MIKQRKIELLAPAKNLECGIEAINHGADAVYIGAPKFGARAAAGNSLEDIAALVAHAHLYNVRIYVTVNTILKEEELAELEEVILLSEFHVKKPESKQMVRLDGRFHEIMYRASGSRMLEHVLTDFLHYVKMARSHSVKTEHRAQESVKEHKRILEAIRQRDGDLAEQLANEHIQHVIENLDLH